MGWIARLLSAMASDGKPPSSAINPPSSPGNAAGRFTPIVTLTDEAAVVVRSTMEQNSLEPGHMLRVGVKEADGGYEYLLGFDDNIDPHQTVRSDSRGIPIVVDIVSIPMLKGTTIHFRNAEGKKGFWFQNPNAM